LKRDLERDHHHAGVQFPVMNITGPIEARHAGVHQGDVQRFPVMNITGPIEARRSGTSTSGRLRFPVMNITGRIEAPRAVA